MKGSMLDMYRRADKLLAAVERLVPIQVNTGLAMAKTSGNPRVFMPLHRGSAGFMSDKQFGTFYWPTLKKLILAFTDAGLTPCVFFEGDYTSRLKYLLELPKGRVLAQLDTTDIFKAKEILGGHLCIRGNVPSSLLQVGTVNQVNDYCKKLIDEVGVDGGFIMSPRSSIDEVKPENLMAMVEFTKEYGVYR
jgi:uroporphyrinogen-III decarboxylase